MAIFFSLDFFSIVKISPILSKRRENSNTFLLSIKYKCGGLGRSLAEVLPLRLAAKWCTLWPLTFNSMVEKIEDWYWRQIPTWALEALQQSGSSDGAETTQRLEKKNAVSRIISYSRVLASMLDWLEREIENFKNREWKIWRDMGVDPALGLKMEHGGIWWVWKRVGSRPGGRVCGCSSRNWTGCLLSGMFRGLSRTLWVSGEPSAGKCWASELLAAHSVSTGCPWAAGHTHSKNLVSATGLCRARTPWNWGDKPLPPAMSLLHLLLIKLALCQRENEEC